MPARPSPTPTPPVMGEDVPVHEPSTTPGGQDVHVHRQVRRLILYYTVLLLLVVVALGFLWQNAGVVRQWASPPWLQELILPLFTTMLGGMMGNVLYSIRVMYAHYIKQQDYDPRWWGKYVSGPFEAAVLALVVYALLRGGVASMTGVPVSAEPVRNPSTVMLGALGLGALVGFSIRDVVGWLQTLSATIFRHDEA